MKFVLVILCCAVIVFANEMEQCRLECNESPQKAVGTTTLVADEDDVVLYRVIDMCICKNNWRRDTYEVIVQFNRTLVFKDEL